MHAVYDEIPDVLADLGLSEVDGVLFDLGVSSMQLDLPERGFAYAVDAPLDMRMDATGTDGPTAADVLNTYDAAELTRVLQGVRRGAARQRIAAAIVRERDREPFTTSGRLVALLYDVIPAPARRTGGHPAKRTFQALRMEVNDELRVLERAMPAAIDAIGVGGRVVVESYHSLEDRLVKRAFTAASRSDVPEDLPFVPEGHEPALRLVTRGAEQANADEIAENPRAASVRLRAIERVRPRPAREPHDMSSTAAQVRARLPRIAEVAVRRARLTVVPRPRTRPRAPRVPFVTLVSLILLGGVVGLLMFNTSMQQASFRAAALEQQVADLTAQEEALDVELQGLRDPQRIASEAQQMDMVLPAGGPLVIDQATGKVLGDAWPDGAPGIPAAADRPRSAAAGVARPGPGSSSATGPTTGPTTGPRRPQWRTRRRAQRRTSALAARFWM